MSSDDFYCQQAKEMAAVIVSSRLVSEDRGHALEGLLTESLRERFSRGRILKLIEELDEDQVASDGIRLLFGNDRAGGEGDDAHESQGSNRRTKGCIASA